MGKFVFGTLFENPAPDGDHPLVVSGLEKI